MVGLRGVRPATSGRRRFEGVAPMAGRVSMAGTPWHKRCCSPRGRRAPDGSVTLSMRNPEPGCPQALLILSYRPTDRLGRGGAPMEYLTHGASFQSTVNNAPSKLGTKHPSFG